MSKIPMPPPLSAEQRAKVLAKLKAEAEKAAPKLVEKLGDKMAASKKPFWRKLVAFFRS